MREERTHLFDNAKFVLMLLVVLGHAMEVTGSEGTAPYKLIYLFHMPTFALVAGFFSKTFKPKAILTLLWQYGLFQLLYCLFARGLGEDVTLREALTTPYWIMWFLFSLIIWKLLAPLLQKTGAHPALVIGLALTVALLSDLVKDINYPFSLSRILLFFPFFLLGVYAKPEHFERLRAAIPRWAAAVGFGLSLFWLAYLFCFSHWILYGTLPLARLRLEPLPGILLVLLLSCWGLVLAACLFVLLPGRECFMSRLGRSTLPCYLLHGFLLRGLDSLGLGTLLPGPAGKLLFYAACLGLALVLMSPPVAGLMGPVLRPPFLRATRPRRARAWVYRA